MDAETVSYWEREALKQAAWKAVSNAVRSGKLPNASLFPCFVCKQKAEGWEHRDYRRPLDVQPVCSPCNTRLAPALPLSVDRTAAMDANQNGVAVVVTNADFDRLQAISRAAGFGTVDAFAKTLLLDKLKSLPIFAVSEEQMAALDGVAVDFDVWAKSPPTAKAAPLRLVAKNRPALKTGTRFNRKLPCGHQSHGHIPTAECARIIGGFQPKGAGTTHD